MSQLLPLPTTQIGPRLYRQKHLVCDESGAPITTPAGRYNDGYRARYIESPEEAQMLLALKREYRGQTVVSRPDIPSDGARCRFEIHLETVAEAAPVVAVAPPTEPVLEPKSLFDDS